MIIFFPLECKPEKMRILNFTSSNNGQQLLAKTHVAILHQMSHRIQGQGRQTMSGFLVPAHLRISRKSLY